ncbi:MAG TPA: MarR family transcriptional regulator [Terriglobales bacterium]|jgi:DNA-binding transcriptional regulator GbsR (MarR family)|nr:MarR family transcriptional regulator [Terriglobales bacterium]
MPQLNQIQRRYILHWGEMGTRWGINRTVAQIHALLFLSASPVSAEDIATTLNIARSNVSTSIRELESWGLVRPVHLLGERREHYESLKDVWEMFRVIVEQRKKREVDPTVRMLQESLAELNKAEGQAYTRERLQDMSEFFDTVNTVYSELNEVSPRTLKAALKVRGKIRKLFQSGG